jgi:hypothetical protein
MEIPSTMVREHNNKEECPHKTQNCQSMTQQALEDYIADKWQRMNHIINGLKSTSSTSSDTPDEFHLKER